MLAGALRDLLVEKPFRHVTVTDIATRAGVNRATFYSHFADKHAMVNDLFRERFAHILERRLAPVTPEPEAFVRALVLAVIDHHVAAQGQCERTYRVFASPVEGEVRTQLRAATLQHWSRHPVTVQPRDGRRLELSAALLSWSAYGAALQWSEDNGGHPPEAFAGEIAPLIAAGVPHMFSEGT
jgi:AcrR family transcriptional regulator